MIRDLADRRGERKKEREEREKGKGEERGGNLCVCLCEDKRKEKCFQQETKAESQSIYVFSGYWFFYF